MNTMSFTAAVLPISRKVLAGAALCAAALTLSPMPAAAWAEYNGYQTSSIWNPSGGATRVYNYDRSGGYFTYVNGTGIMYGSVNYTLHHPYVNRNYDHWCWDFSRGNWSAIHTKKLARY